MRYTRITALAATVLTLSLTACASTPQVPPKSPTPPAPVNLHAMMTPAQFKAAGLDKLSAGELESLGGWLTGRLQPPPAPTEAGSAVQKDFGLPPKPKPEPDNITSRITGHFDGWDGNTVFKLQNGQIWKQAGFGNFVHHADNPEVYIRKGWFGYLLRIKGYNATVAVRRIK